MVDDTKKDRWLNWLALTTIVFSACSTFASFYGGGNSTKAVVSQAQASDAWAYFQAKSVKQHSFQLQRDLITLQAATLDDSKAAAFKEKIAEYSKEIERYKTEKKEAETDARNFEATKT